MKYGRHPHLLLPLSHDCQTKIIINMSHDTQEQPREGAESTNSYLKYIILLHRGNQPYCQHTQV